VTRCRSPGNRGSRQHEGDANTSQAWARIERSKGVPARRVRVAEFGRRRSGSKKRQYGVNPRGREREPSASGGVRDLTEAAVLGERRSVENRIVVAKSRYRERAESVPHRRKRGWGQGFGCHPREGTSGRGSRRFSRGDGGIGLGGPRIEPFACESADWQIAREATGVSKARSISNRWIRNEGKKTPPIVDTTRRSDRGVVKRHDPHTLAAYSGTDGTRVLVVTKWEAEVGRTHLASRRRVSSQGDAHDSWPSRTKAAHSLTR
jgi:hypothetical protein